MVKGRNTKTVAVRLSDDEAKALKVMAAEYNTTVSDIIRTALGDYGLTVKTDDIKRFDDRLDAVVRVQQKILGDLDQLRISISDVAEYYLHIIWDKDDKPKTVMIDGKRIKSFPLYWVRAVKRS